MEYLKAFIIGITEGFFKLIPSSLEGHLSLYKNTFFKIPQGSWDTLVPIVVGASALISIGVYKRKLISPFAKGFVKVIKNLKTVKPNTEDKEEKLFLNVFFGSLGFLLYPVFSALFKNSAGSLMMTAIMFFISGFMLLFSFRFISKDKTTTINSLPYGIFKSLSAFTGFSGMCGMIFTGIFNGEKRYDLTDILYPVCFFAITASVVGGLMEKLVIHYDVLYYILVFFGGLISSYGALWLTDTALKKKKEKYFGIYNIIIAILTFLIWMRG